MAIEYTILGEIGLVFSRWSGTIDLPLIMAAMETYANDPDRVDHRLELIDARDVEHLEIDVSDLRRILAAETEPEGDLSKRRSSILVGSTLASGLGRQYQGLAGRAGDKISIHREEGPALAALGRGEATLAELLAAWPHPVQMTPVPEPEGHPPGQLSKKTVA
ncbi:MAG: hypothetical protein AAF666_06285 [Pseudomonadota bacterium]